MPQLDSRITSSTAAIEWLTELFDIHITYGHPEYQSNVAMEQPGSF
jgi:hypothetical protein